MATDKKKWFPFYGWCVWIDPDIYINSKYWQYEETVYDIENCYDILYDPSKNYYGYTCLEELD